MACSSLRSALALAFQIPFRPVGRSSLPSQAHNAFTPRASLSRIPSHISSSVLRPADFSTTATRPKRKSRGNEKADPRISTAAPSLPLPVHFSLQRSTLSVLTQFSIDTLPPPPPNHPTTPSPKTLPDTLPAPLDHPTRLEPLPISPETRAAGRTGTAVQRDAIRERGVEGWGGGWREVVSERDDEDWRLGD